MKITFKTVLASLCCIGIVGAPSLAYVASDFVYYRLHVHSIFAGSLLSFMIVIVYIGLLLILMAIIEYPGAQEEVSKIQDSHELKPIASDHGSSLEEVMKTIRNEELEYLAYFSLDGEKLAEGTYLSPIKCSITTEDWNDICYEGEEVMKVHNHPGSSNVAFSAQDFKAFLCQDFIRKTIVVTKDYNYTMEKIGNGYEDLQDDAKAYVERMDEEYLWISAFSNRLWSVVTARKAAKEFGLKFSAKCIRQRPIKRYAFYGLAVCAIVTMFCLVKPQPSASTSDPNETITATQLANEVCSGHIETPM